jgi:hypothetical protein
MMHDFRAKRRDVNSLVQVFLQRARSMSGGSGMMRVRVKTPASRATSYW